jgi:hypothetical protein
MKTAPFCGAKWHYSCAISLWNWPRKSMHLALLQAGRCVQTHAHAQAKEEVTCAGANPNGFAPFFQLEDLIHHANP